MDGREKNSANIILLMHIVEHKNIFITEDLFEFQTE